MNNSNQTTFLDPESLEINNVKEILQDKSWDEIKNNKEIISKTLSTDYIVNPADLLIQDRTFFLSRIFENYQIIPDNKATKILEIFASFNMGNGLAKLNDEINKKFPGLKVIQTNDYTKLQQDSKRLINGLHNAKNIATLKITEEIFHEVSRAKKIPSNQLNVLLSQLNNIINKLRSKIDKSEDPNKEDIQEAAEFLKNLGRTPFEIEKLKNTDNIMPLISILRNLQEAFEVVQEAHQTGVTNKLNDLGVVADILIKIKSK